MPRPRARGSACQARDRYIYSTWHVIYHRGAAPLWPPCAASQVSGSFHWKWSASHLDRALHCIALRQQVLGSCKCDCRQQLDFALEAIDAEPLGGVVIYMQQARPA